jgi:hypothetical protein
VPFEGCADDADDVDQRAREREREREMRDQRVRGDVRDGGVS